MKILKGSYLSNRIILNKIDIYNCWEDYRLIQKGLDINSNDIVFSITSGGCNILNFLIYDPKKIISVDYNPYQNYLLEIKIAAIKNLCHSDFLQFMGVNPYNKNEKLYKSIRSDLSENARKYWDLNSYVINKGITCVGEDDVKKFGIFLRFLKGKKTIENFFNCKTIDEQSNYFKKYIYGYPWKLFLYYAYNDFIMRSTLILHIFQEFIYRRKRHLDKEFLRYIKKIHYPKNHLEKIEYIFTKIPIKDNFYASQILLGRYINKNCLPPYLKKQNFNFLKQKLDRIEIKTSSVYEVLKELPNEYITKFNLSNIFDWIDDESFSNHLKQIIRVGKNKGRFFYSTARNDRNIPKEFNAFSSEKEYANKLIKEDRTTMYSNLVLGNILK